MTLSLSDTLRDIYYLKALKQSPTVEGIQGLSESTRNFLFRAMWAADGRPQADLLYGETKLLTNPTLLKTIKTSSGELLVDAVAQRILKGKPLVLASSTASVDPTRHPPSFNKRKIVIISTEMTGVYRHGGLAEAVRGLADALISRGHQVEVMLPNCPALLPPTPYEGNIKVTLLRTSYPATREEGVYGGVNLTKRMILFATEAAKWCGDADVVIGNDWPGAYAIHCLDHRPTPPPTILVVHNNGYGAQGSIAPGLNCLRAGMCSADAVVAVSQGFARDMQTRSLGFDLDSLAKQTADLGKLNGILNGSNPALWNPLTDPQLKNWVDPETGEKIDLTYGPDDPLILEKKRRICEQLQKWFKKYRPELLEESGINFTSGELILSVGRLDSSQKGLELFAPAIRISHSLGANFVAIGMADPADQDARKMLDEAKLTAKGKRALVIEDTRNGENKFDVQQGSREKQGIGSLLRAAATITFMPSKFEPCGLVQFEAWLFGSLVIGTSTGGLADTIHEGNGWTFPRTTPWASADQGVDLFLTIQKALTYYRSLDDDQKREVMSRVMKEAQHMSWTDGSPSPVERYERVIEAAIQAQKDRKEKTVTFAPDRA